MPGQVQVHPILMPTPENICRYEEWLAQHASCARWVQRWVGLFCAIVTELAPFADGDRFVEVIRKSKVVAWMEVMAFFMLAQLALLVCAVINLVCSMHEKTQALMNNTCLAVSLLQSGVSILLLCVVLDVLGGSVMDMLVFTMPTVIILMLSCRPAIKPIYRLIKR